VFKIRVFSLYAFFNFLGGVLFSFFFVLIPLVLILLPVRAQLDFSGDLVVRHTIFVFLGRGTRKTESKPKQRGELEHLVVRP